MHICEHRYSGTIFKHVYNVLVVVEANRVPILYDLDWPNLANECPKILQLLIVLKLPNKKFEGRHIKESDAND